jgi:hypothetical protein
LSQIAAGGYESGYILKTHEAQIPIIQNEPIADPKQRAAAAATACATGSRQPVERPIYVARVGTRNFRNEIGSPTWHMVASRRPVLSSGEASGWFLAKDLHSKKRPCTGHISYCRRAIFGTSAPPLLSLRAAIYSPVPFIGAVLALSHQASIQSLCRSALLCFRSDSSCSRRSAIELSAGLSCDELRSWICSRGMRSL